MYEMYKYMDIITLVKVDRSGVKSIIALSES